MEHVGFLYLSLEKSSQKIDPFLVPFLYSPHMQHWESNFEILMVLHVFALLFSCLKDFFFIIFEHYIIVSYLLITCNILLIYIVLPKIFQNFYLDSHILFYFANKLLIEVFYSHILQQM